MSLTQYCVCRVCVCGKGVFLRRCSERKPGKAVTAVSSRYVGWLISCFAAKVNGRASERARAGEIGHRIRFGGLGGQAHAPHTTTTTATTSTYRPGVALVVIRPGRARGSETGCEKAEWMDAPLICPGFTVRWTGFERLDPSGASGVLVRGVSQTLGAPLEHAGRDRRISLWRATGWDRGRQ